MLEMIIDVYVWLMLVAIVWCVRVWWREIQQW